MYIKKYKVPHTRDPFINTPLIKAGRDEKTGEERFWISTWNANVGCLGALVTASGKSRIYHFEKVNDGLIGCGAYSAVLTDNDTMWLMSDIKAFVKLTLSTGDYEIYPTGAPSALVFAGMQYDAETKKLLAIAYPFSEIHAVSFDTVKKETVKIHTGITKATCAHGGFANGDGTYTFKVENVQPSLHIWSPKDETITELCAVEKEFRIYKTVRDDKGRIYVPYSGWLDVANRSFASDNMAEIEAEWFGRKGDIAFGANNCGDVCEIYTWNLSDGKIEKICTTDCCRCELTENGEIIAVSVFGILNVFSADGELILSRKLESDAPGQIDCIVKVDDKTLLGTPFITQRFWLLDTETGEGFDAGRAACGFGEVLRTWNINGKIYMASYCEGYLSEYDPAKPLGYPENPRIVAQAPGGMRPVADAEIGESLYFACNHHYGILGSTLTKYNTKTGEVLHLDDPLPNQHIISMKYCEKCNAIVGSTTYASDCYAAPSESDVCYIVKISGETLEITDKVQVPKGCEYARIYGAIDENTLLMGFEKLEGEKCLASYNVVDDTVELLNINLTDYGIDQILYMSEEGKFAVRVKGNISLCDVSNEGIKVGPPVLADDDIYSIYVSKGNIYAATPTELYEIGQWI